MRDNQRMNEIPDRDPDVGTAPADATTHFGYRDVPVADKAKLVGAVFTSVASKYDVMNDFMSLGIHRLWKRHFAATSNVREGDRVLDLAGGTGDIAALLMPRVGERGSIVVGDINAAMLAVGRSRLINRGVVRGIEYAQTDAECLPFANGVFNAVTIAFGLRNVTDQAAALREMKRVLAPGGRVLILEFSTVGEPLLKRAYDLYSFEVLPRIGQIVAKDADSYRYLAESIRRHPDQATLSAMMQDAGFLRVSHRSLAGGIVAIHSGYAV